jgi:hypothetical protein
MEVELPGKCWKNAGKMGKLSDCHEMLMGFHGDGLAIGIPNL